MLYNTINGERINLDGMEGADFHEIPLDTIRRCCNRLSRTRYEWERTTANTSAEPNTLEGCFAVMKDVVSFNINWGQTYIYSHSVSEYMGSVRRCMTDRGLRYITWGNHVYLYTSIYRESIIIAVWDWETGEVICHLPWEKWDEFMGSYPQKRMCSQTGTIAPACDPQQRLVQLRGNYGGHFDIPDMKMWVSRTWVEADCSTTICPNCGTPMIAGYTCREVWDWSTQSERVVCNCTVDSQGFYCEYHHRYEVGSAHHTVSGDWLCDVAYEETEHERCDRCGNEHYTTQFRDYVDEDDGTVLHVCSWCYDNLTRDDIPWRNPWGRMRHWSKPTPKFYGLGEDGSIKRSRTALERMYVGIELELDQEHRCRRSGDDADGLAIDLMKHFRGSLYCEDDSSLRTGCECVTMPHTVPAYHAFDWDFLLEKADERNLAANHTCGMHTHVSRTAFGGNRPTQARNIAKLAMLIDEHWDWFWTLSRREDVDDEHWCKPSTFDGDWDDYIDDMTSAGHDVNDDDRYYAVNVQNSNTVEIRLWAASTDKDTIVGTIDTVEALVNLVKDESAETLYDLTDEGLRDMLLKHATYKDSVETLLKSVGL